jgi:beta-galactosidase
MYGPTCLSNRVGKGQAIYVGTALTDSFYEAFTRQIVAAAGVLPVHRTPDGVTVKARLVNDQPLLFVMNHTTESKTIALPRRMRDVLLDREIGLTHVLPPRDVLVLM